MLTRVGMWISIVFRSAKQHGASGLRYSKEILKPPVIAHDAVDKIYPCERSAREARGREVGSDCPLDEAFREVPTIFTFP